MDQRKQTKELSCCEYILTASEHSPYFLGPYLNDSGNEVPQGSVLGPFLFSYPALYFCDTAWLYPCWQTGQMQWLVMGILAAHFSSGSINNCQSWDRCYTQVRLMPIQCALKRTSFYTSETLPNSYPFYSKGMQRGLRMALFQAYSTTAVLSGQPKNTLLVL